MRLSEVMWINRTFSEGLMSSFYKFLARFSGRRRGCHMRGGRMRLSLLPVFATLALLQFLTPSAEGCSSRPTPKPRPPSTTSRPNVTFQTYPCTPEHDAYFCLNGGKCFGVKIGDELPMPNCYCADGFVGMRCEFKDLVGSYISSRRVMLETASIASGATIAVFLVVVICMFLYVRVQRKNKQNLTITREGSSREDLEKRAASHRDGLPYPVHHVFTERGDGDIRLAVYNVRVNTDPP